MFNHSIQLSDLDIRKNTHQTTLTSRENTIIELEHLLEPFLENLIIEPLKNTTYFGLNKTLTKEFCRYLREHWQNTDEKIIDSYLTKLISSGEDQVVQLVEKNIRLYSILRLRINSLKNLKVNESHCFKEMKTGKMLQYVQNYKEETDIDVRNKITRKLKEVIDSLYVFPQVNYSAFEFIRKMNENQFFLTRHILNVLTKIEKAIPYKRKEIEVMLNYFLDSLKIENQKLFSKRKTFADLYLQLNKYMSDISYYPINSEFLNLVRTLAEMVQIFDEFKEKVDQLKLAEINTYQIPLYQIDFLEEDALQIMQSWLNIVTAQFKSMKPTIAPTESKKENAKPPEAAPPKESKNIQKEEKLTAEQELILKEVYTFHDSPFVKKHLDDTTMYCLTKLFQNIREDNYEFTIRDLRKQMYSLKAIAEKAMIEYRMSGQVPINFLKAAFDGIKDHYRFSEQKDIPFKLKEAINIYEVLIKSIKLEDRVKNEKSVLLFVSKEKSFMKESIFDQSKTKLQIEKHGSELSDIDSPTFEQRPFDFAF